MRLGAHESIAGGLVQAFERGKRATCETIQIFTKSNRQWRAKPLSEDDVVDFRQRMAEEKASGGIFPVVAHTAYLINVASPKAATWDKSYRALKIELERCETLGIPYLVLHPGSYTQGTEQEGLENVLRALNRLHAETPGFRTMICLESMAGQGTNLGSTFEHLVWLIQEAEQGDRLGVCLDSCHMFAAGYELRTAQGYAATMAEFEHVVGLDRLKCLHLNDSVGELGSQRDRHAHIGEGEIGLSGFAHLVNDPRLADLPGLLETPKSTDLHEDVENLAKLRRLIEA